MKTRLLALISIVALGVTSAAVSPRAAPKTTALSSPVKVYGYSAAEWNVSRRASPPSAGMTKTSTFP